MIPVHTKTRLMRRRARADREETVKVEREKEVTRKPVRIEPVTGKLVLPAGQWLVQPLTAEGLPRGQAKIDLRGIGRIVMAGRLTRWTLRGHSSAAPAG